MMPLQLLYTPHICTKHQSMAGGLVHSLIRIPTHDDHDEFIYTLKI